MMKLGLFGLLQLCTQYNRNTVWIIAHICLTCKPKIFVRVGVCYSIGKVVNKNWRTPPCFASLPKFGLLCVKVSFIFVYPITMLLASEKYCNTGLLRIQMCFRDTRAVYLKFVGCLDEIPPTVSASRLFGPFLDSCMDSLTEFCILHKRNLPYLLLFCKLACPFFTSGKHLQTCWLLILPNFSSPS